MKKYFLMISFCGFFLACQAQSETIGKKIGEAAGVGRPMENWSVNKKLDENGRVIQYDSTYSLFYSNTNKWSDFNWPEKNNPFGSFFNDDFFSILGTRRFHHLWEDSLKLNFIPKMPKQNSDIFSPFPSEYILKRLDSIHRQFFRQYYEENAKAANKINQESKKT